MLLRTLDDHNTAAYSVALSADGQTLISGGKDGVVILWDVATGKKLSSLKKHKDAVHSLALSANGQRLVSGSGDKLIRIWEKS